jgi:hypothetical protein
VIFGVLGRVLQQGAEEGEVRRVGLEARVAGELSSPRGSKGGGGGLKCRGGGGPLARGARWMGLRCEGEGVGLLEQSGFETGMKWSDGATTDAFNQCHGREGGSGAGGATWRRGSGGPSRHGMRRGRGRAPTSAAHGSSGGGQQLTRGSGWHSVRI